MRNKILFVVLTFLLLLQISFAQTATTVYTCTGGSVSAYLRDEFSTDEIDAANAQTISDYSYLSPTIVGNSSNQYNCHAYAWHLTEGNSNKVWINNATFSSNGCYGQTYNIDPYWNNGCFIQVCNESDADKVHYYCGDHSAVKSTNAGYYVSKWGQLALVESTMTNVPYPPTNLVNYYASTKITGDISTPLCSGSTRTFTVKSISGASYSWSCSSSLNINSGGSSNQVTVQYNSNDANAWVEVTINTSCSTTATRRLYLVTGFGTNSINYTQKYMTCSGTHPYFYGAVAAIPFATNYNWYAKDESNSSNSFVLKESGSNSADFPLFGGNRYYTIRVVVTTPCGTLQSIDEDGYIFAESCSNGGNSIKNRSSSATPELENMISVFPNPANNILYVSVPSTIIDLKMAMIKMIDGQGRIVKKVGTVNSINRINITNLSQGTYVVEITDGKRRIVKKVIKN